MASAGEPSGKVRALAEETGEQSVKMGANDLEKEGGSPGTHRPLIELTENVLGRLIGEAFGELFVNSPESSQSLSLGRGLEGQFHPSHHLSPFCFRPDMERT